VGSVAEEVITGAVPVTVMVMVLEVSAFKVAWQEGAPALPDAVNSPLDEIDEKPVPEQLQLTLFVTVVVGPLVQVAVAESCSVALVLIETPAGPITKLTRPRGVIVMT